MAQLKNTYKCISISKHAFARRCNLMKMRKVSCFHAGENTWGSSAVKNVGEFYVYLGKLEISTLLF